MPDLKTKAKKEKTRKFHKDKNQKNKIFPDTLFKHNIETDTYTCPGNKILKKKSYHASRESIDYSARKTDCFSCELRSHCTRNKMGRTIKRHLKQDVTNEMREKSQAYKAKMDIRKRQHLMERTFANATRYRFDRARWRSLARVSIQELLICSMQNIQCLIKPRIKPKQAIAMQIQQQEVGEVKCYVSRETSKINDYFVKISMFYCNFFRHLAFLGRNSAAHIFCQAT